MAPRSLNDRSGNSGASIYVAQLKPAPARSQPEETPAKTERTGSERSDPQFEHVAFSSRREKGLRSANRV